MITMHSTKDVPSFFKSVLEIGPGDGIVLISFTFSKVQTKEFGDLVKILWP